ncbi:hypothetical protein DFP73DRAFT_26084 [Morchella snyderi]|nr:hypothetical protein DFP73DRAFT_26084 [Morchella snyderi]
MPQAEWDLGGAGDEPACTCRHAYRILTRCFEESRFTNLRVDSYSQLLWGLGYLFLLLFFFFFSLRYYCSHFVSASNCYSYFFQWVVRRRLGAECSRVLFFLFFPPLLLPSVPLPPACAWRFSSRSLFTYSTYSLYC